MRAPRAVVHNMEWTPGQTERLRELWADPALSASAIAALLGAGCTRFMVLAKARRLHLASRLEDHPEIANAAAARRAQAARKEAALGFVLPRRQPALAGAAAGVLAPALGPQPATAGPALAPPTLGCRFIEADDFLERMLKGARFEDLICGKPTLEPGGSWCADHHKRVWRPGTAYPAPADSPRLLVSGRNSRKIGDRIVKGAWAGFAVYTLTLEVKLT